jgi:hypothetical protein
MILLMIAGLNALIFHRFTFRFISYSNGVTVLTTGATLAAIFSIILWIAVITCGRLLAY